MESAWRVKKENFSILILKNVSHVEKTVLSVMGPKIPAHLVKMITGSMRIVVMVVAKVSVLLVSFLKLKIVSFAPSNFCFQISAVFAQKTK